MKIIHIIIAAVIIPVFYCGCSSKDAVDRLFLPVSARLPINYNTPEYQETDRYKIYSVTQEQIDQILSDDFKDFSFTGWRDCTQNKTMGLKKPYKINPHTDTIKINSKINSDDFNSVDIYLNLTTQKIILHNGLTYGR